MEHQSGQGSRHRHWNVIFFFAGHLHRCSRLPADWQWYQDVMFGKARYSGAAWGASPPYCLRSSRIAGNRRGLICCALTRAREWIAPIIFFAHRFAVHSAVVILLVIVPWRPSGFRSNGIAYLTALNSCTVGRLSSENWRDTWALNGVSAWRGYSSAPFEWLSLGRRRLHHPLSYKQQRPFT